MVVVVEAQAFLPLFSLRNDRLFTMTSTRRTNVIEPRHSREEEKPRRATDTRLMKTFEKQNVV